MKKSNAIYYLLFVLLIMGAFASMAQNAYGQKILGLVAIAFSFSFGVRVFFLAHEKHKDAVSITESTALTLLAGILALRVFYIRFDFVEVVFMLSGAALVAVYGIKAVRIVLNRAADGIWVSMAVAVFYISLITYVLSMTMTPLAPALSEPLGILAFMLIMIFVVFIFVKKDVVVAGERVSPLKRVTQSNDQSVTLVILFLLFTGYAGLTKLDLLPKMYSDQYPHAYFDLVRKAEGGQEKSQGHEEFKAVYDKFVKRHRGTSEK